MLFLINMLFLGGALLATYLYGVVPAFVSGIVTDTFVAKAITIFFTVVIVSLVLAMLGLGVAAFFYFFAGAAVMAYKLYGPPSKTATPAA